jgi:hypothetical protein
MMKRSSQNGDHDGDVLSSGNQSSDIAESKTQKTRPSACAKASNIQT